MNNWAYSNFHFLWNWNLVEWWWQPKEFPGLFWKTQEVWLLSLSLIWISNFHFFMNNWPLSNYVCWVLEVTAQRFWRCVKHNLCHKTLIVFSLSLSLMWMPFLLVKFLLVKSDAVVSLFSFFHIAIGQIRFVVKCMSPPSPITISRIIQPIVWSAVITIVLYSALSIPLSVLHPVRIAPCVDKELFCILLYYNARIQKSTICTALFCILVYFQWSHKRDTEYRIL